MDRDWPNSKPDAVSKTWTTVFLFLGRLPYETLPEHLALLDICLSTQTNDAAGQVRTTGKLPLYLASGRFVLSTEVGEAARVLPPDMLLPYDGTKDSSYPARLSARVESLLTEPDKFHQVERSVAIAKAHFDYDVLSGRLRELLSSVLATTDSEYQKLDRPLR